MKRKSPRGGDQRIEEKNHVKRRPVKSLVWGGRPLISKLKEEGGPEKTGQRGMGFGKGSRRRGKGASTKHPRTELFRADCL